MLKEPRSQHVIIVGAGIAGLAAAWRLQRACYTVTVLERETHVGGRMATIERDGYHLALGAVWLPQSYHHMIQLVAEAGLTPQMAPTTDILGLSRQGTIYRLPLHQNSALLRTRLLSWRAKLKAVNLAWDAYRARPLLGWADMSAAETIDTESAHDYAQRRLNQELYDYLVEPLCLTWYYADPRQVSAVGLFLALWALIGYGAFTFPDGPGQLPTHLARQLPVELEAEVTSVEEAPGGVQVCWQRHGELHNTHAAACILAVPGPLAPKLTPQLRASQRDYLAQLSYQPDVRVSFGLTRPPTEPSGLVFAAPRDHTGISYLSLEHRISPHAVPAGKGLISLHLHPTWSRERLKMSDAEITADALAALRALFPGLANHIEAHRDMTFVHRWQHAILTRPPGGYRALAAFTRSLDPRSRIQFAGDYLSLTLTNAALATGERAAARIHASLSSRGQHPTDRLGDRDGDATHQEGPGSGDREWYRWIGRRTCAGRSFPGRCGSRT